MAHHGAVAVVVRAARLLAVLGAVAVAVSLVPTAVAQPVGEQSATRKPPVRPLVAPYVDMGLWPTANLSAMSAATGVRTFTAAFVTTETGTVCSPAWGGYAAYAVGGPGDFSDIIAPFQATGGRVIVSFGGAFGPEIADTCTSDTELHAAYQRVIDRYRVNRLDFDIEGTSIANVAANQRRARVLAQVQRQNARAGRPVAVTLTLPVMPDGLTADGLRIVREFAAAGVAIAAVNVMAMDYGDEYVAMGAHAISAARATAAQLKTIPAFRRLSTAQRMALVGITPMIGQNDIASEVFTIADASAVAAFAKANGIGMLAWWEMTRDKPCTVVGEGLSTCSGVAAPQWAFAKAFRAGLR